MFLMGSRVALRTIEFVLLSTWNTLWFGNNHKRRRWSQKEKNQRT